jgi:hypothetical protein
VNSQVPAKRVAFDREQITHIIGHMSNFCGVERIHGLDYRHQSNAVNDVSNNKAKPHGIILRYTTHQNVNSEKDWENRLDTALDVI